MGSHRRILSRAVTQSYWYFEKFRLTSVQSRDKNLVVSHPAPT